MPDLYPAWSHFIQEKLEVSFTYPGTSKNNFTILCSIFGYYELTCYVENSVDPGSTLFLIVYVCIHTVSKGVYTCILFKHSEAPLRSLCISVLYYGKKNFLWDF